MVDYAALRVGVSADTSDMERTIASSASRSGQAAADTMGSKLKSGLGSAATAVGKVMATGFTVAAGGAAALTAATIGSGIAYNTLYQRSSAAFTTILGSGDAAKKMMADISAFAKTSPFPRQAFIEATQQMLGFGVESQRVIPYLNAIQDAVAATGGGVQDIAELSEIFSKITASGKITSVELMQLGKRGIDAAGLIGNAMGKTGAQIRDEISSGSLDAQTALDALVTGMEGRYGGAAENVKNTFVGAVDRIKGAMRDVGSAIVEPFISKEGGGYAVEWANKIADLFRALEPAIAPLISSVMNKLAPAFEKANDVVTKVIDKIKELVTGGAGKAVDGLASAFGSMAPVLGVVSGLFLKIGGANIAGVLGPLGPLVAGLTGPFGMLGTVIAALVTTSPALRGALLDIVGAAMSLVGPIFELVKAVGAELEPIFRAIAPIISDVAKILAEHLGRAVRDLAPLLKPLARIIKDLVDWVKNLTPAFHAVGLAVRTFVIGLGPVIKLLEAIWDSPLRYVILAIAAAWAVWTLAIWAMNTAMLASPLTLIILGIVALIVVIGLVVTHFDTLKDAVLTAFNAVKDAIVTAVNFVLDFVKANWPYIVGLMLGPIGLVVAAVYKNFDTIKSVVTTVLGAVLDFVRSVWESIKGVFTGAFNSVTATVSSGMSAILGFFQRLPGQILGFLTGFPTMLVGHGRDVISGLLNGIKAMWDTVYSWFSGLPSKIIGFFGNAGTWLLDAGKKIITGLLDGIKNAMGAVQDFVGGIAGKIMSWKGPLDYDRTILVGAGVAIMQGLIGGVRSMLPDLKHTMGDVTHEVARIEPAINAALPSQFAAAAAPSVAGMDALAGRGGSVVVENANFYDELDLETFMRQAAWMIQTRTA
jgi:tape measure domain-containing protein